MKNSVEIKVPSLKFTQAFIEDLGTLLEGELAKSVDPLKARLKKTKDPYRVSRIRSEIDHFHIEYLHRYQDETTRSSSVDELLALVPTVKFARFHAKVYSYLDENFVDLEIYIRPDLPSISMVTISGNNKDLLILMKEKIKRIFKKYQTSYHFVYNFPEYVLSLTPFVISLPSTYLLVSWLHDLKVIRTEMILIIYFTAFLIITGFYQKMSKYFMPYIQFEGRSIKIIAFFLSGVVVIFWDAVYDILKLLLGVKQ